VAQRSDNVCERRADGGEICDRFWPDQKQTETIAADPQTEFLRQINEAVYYQAEG
jgi:hypothetical protein